MFATGVRVLVVSALLALIGSAAVASSASAAYTWMLGDKAVKNGSTIEHYEQVKTSYRTSRVDFLQDFSGGPITIADELGVIREDDSLCTLEPPFLSPGIGTGRCPGDIFGLYIKMSVPSRSGLQTVYSTLTTRTIVVGTGKRDEIRMGPGPDDIRAKSGGDFVEGGAGANTLDGGNHDDFVVGGPDGDTITGGNHYDTLLGEDGADTISGDNHDDVLEGGSGADSLNGGRGNDYLNGGPDPDLLNGHTGNDRIYPSTQGDDTILCGGGSDDTVYLQPGDLGTVIPADCENVVQL